VTILAMSSKSKTTGKREASSPPDRDVRVVKRRTSSSASSTTDPVLLLSSAPANLTWCNFRHILVFGDSYSSDTETNWIGHLQKKICSPEGPPCIHNYAVAGDTVEDDLGSQLGRLFKKFPTSESLENGDRTLCVIWMGINDCGRTDADDLGAIVELIFDAMHDLYVKWKVRSFMLMDVPPMQRSPGGMLMNIDAERYDTWNEQLLEQAETFANSASKTSVFVVSAHYIISDILDHPEQFGFSNSSRDEGLEEPFDDDDGEARDIWGDDIHLSSAAHRVFARRLLKLI